MDYRTKLTANITLKEVEAVMKTQFKPHVNTPKKLLKSFLEENTKAVFLATRCSECGEVFLHLSIGEDLTMYKQYELYSISWGDDSICPLCGSVDSLFLQHHTGKVIFDISGIPDVAFSLFDADTIKYCKIPLLEEVAIVI